MTRAARGSKYDNICGLNLSFQGRNLHGTYDISLYIYKYEEFPMSLFLT